MRKERKRTSTGVEPGPILDTSGKVVGEHPGHQHFTIGQRRKVGVALGHPIFVVEKDPATNSVVVGTREELASEGCRASDTNWLIDPPRDWMKCLARIRYNGSAVPAEVRVTGDDGLEVRFESPQDAVAPGQAVVCYDDRMVLGGGWIDAAVRSSS